MVGSIWFSNELGRYKYTDFLATISPDEFHNFDILAWWKIQEPHYPVLAAMARDLLSSQASTVASESAFSLSGRVLSIRRTRLTPEAMEMCICLKDYLDGVERIQHVSNLEGELDVEEQLHEVEVYQGRAQPLSDDELMYDESVRSTSPRSD
ncbi:putative HAT dimerization domain, ribonuclease H-like superfamily [Helianthus annuus]|nr:putative HAT dimerization domain, ribonuclease H-like superfamily [Helianthus annuus]